MQNQRVRTPYVPVMHCKKMAVTDMSFRQCVVIELVVKEGNSTGIISERLHGMCIETPAWVPAVSEGG
jgi:hypothetical protein